jgi:single-strand DNA-binding protein
MSNSVTVCGTLQTDPELKFIASGKAVANFTVRDTPPTVKGEKRPASFFDVTVWGDLAEHVSASLEKGDRVLVSGKLEQQKWETPEGDKRSKVVIVGWQVGPELSYSEAEVIRAESEEPVPAAVGADPGF